MYLFERQGQNKLAGYGRELLQDAWSLSILMV